MLFPIDCVKKANQIRAFWSLNLASCLIRQNLSNLMNWETESQAVTCTNKYCSKKQPGDILIGYSYHFVVNFGSVPNYCCFSPQCQILVPGHPDWLLASWRRHDSSAHAQVETTQRSFGNADMVQSGCENPPKEHPTYVP